MVRNHPVPSPGPSSTPGFGAGAPVASVNALLGSPDFLPASGHSFPVCCVGGFPLPIPWLRMLFRRLSRPSRLLIVHIGPGPFPPCSSPSVLETFHPSLQIQSPPRALCPGSWPARTCQWAPLPPGFRLGGTSRRLDGDKTRRLGCLLPAGPLAECTPLPKALTGSLSSLATTLTYSGNQSPPLTPRPVVGWSI